MGRARKTVHAKVLNYGSYEVYSDYKKEREKLEFPIVDKMKHREVLSECYKEIYRAMLEKLMIFEAPYSFGKFYIREERGKKFRAWIKDKETGEAKPVWKYNNHTDGIKFKLWWDKFNARCPCLREYICAFEEGRSDEGWGKAGVHKYIVESWSDPYKENFRGYIE